MSDCSRLIRLSSLSVNGGGVVGWLGNLMLMMIIVAAVFHFGFLVQTLSLHNLGLAMITR